MPVADRTPRNVPKIPAALTAVFAIGWGFCLASWMWIPSGSPLPDGLQGLVFVAALPVSLAWVIWAKRSSRAGRAGLYVTLTMSFIACWQLGVYASDLAEWDLFRTYLARTGTAGSFLIGLAWLVWGLELAARRFDSRRRRSLPAADAAMASTGGRGSDSSGAKRRPANPLDPAAWYYGRHSPRLNQSLAALLGYSIAFLLIFLMMTRLGGCRELYEMPAGGGEQKSIAQTVKVQKIIKKKFVVNPFSAISFKVPPIDEVKLQLTEITEHAYTVGYGQGAGAGFAGGTKGGQVRFIRLEYAGGDWDQDFGIGADVNMLIEYGIRTKQRVARRTESRTIAQLKNFPPEKSPPFVYLTGQRNISISDSEVKILREYLLEKRGMIFGDNGGSAGFHNQFLGMMRRVLPQVRPSRVPLDDQIHRVPFQIPFLPYVAPHGGKDALGWRVDGRLVCYYHPGDIGDAWTDDHSGVSPEIYEACYQLGTNVIFYAHAEYSKWLASRQKQKE